MTKITQQKTSPKKISALFLAAFIFVNFVSIQHSYSAPEYGIERLRSCNTTSGGIEGLEFNPTTGGKDAKFVLSNPVCATVIATSYFNVKVGIASMNRICSTGSAVPRITPSIFLDARDLTRAGIKAAATNNPVCGKAVLDATGAFTLALAQLGIIYGVAKGAYENSEVCGSNWTAVNPSKYDRNTPLYKATVQAIIDQRIRDNLPALLSLNTGDKTYREWYYGGVEVEDNPDDGEICYDVTQTPDSNGHYPRQKYYLRGSELGNFNCENYLVTQGRNDPATDQSFSEKRVNLMNTAYACCKKRSSEFVCIKYDPPGALPEQKVFCRAGSRCTISGVTFSAKSVDDGRFVCAESYSLCPYNFSVGGGTQDCDYYRDGIWDGSNWVMIRETDINPPAGQAVQCSTRSEIRNPDCTYNNKAGKCRNYCQYLTHCTRTSSPGFHYRSGLSSPYFSDACLNFVGDSQNKTSYGGGFILGSQKHFSAPIAQCVKETLENVFYNRAGHSKCLNYNELPSADGSCPSGSYAGVGTFVHRKGNPVKERSFFTATQDLMEGAVKMVLTLSIMFFGMNMLMQKKGFDIREKKDMLVYLFKIVIVLYFATGDAWQSKFFEGVYGVSSEFSRMVFKIETNQSPLKRDGCQFGEITTPDGITTPTGSSYPSGKSYLAIWDTLDCKIMRYLGFGPEASVANIASLVIAGFLTPFAAIGVFFAVSVMFFGIFFVSATIRALHIFLCSCISIIIMVFVSPVIFPCLLFDKTKGMFDKWITNLLSFCLQPMILFAYIAIFIIALDRTVIGSATFVGQGPFKAISCQSICKDRNGAIVPYNTDGTAPECDGDDQELINPLNDSLACLINVQDFGKFPGFELIGLSIPMLVNLFSENPRERLMVVTKAALVMYLLYSFMDEIPGITARLIGGTGISGGASGAGGNPLANMKKLAHILQGFQKRAKGASRKIAGKLGDKGKSVARSAGSKGKSIRDNGSGADAAGSTDGNNADSGETPPDGKGEAAGDTSPEGVDEGGENK